jgi:NADPH-dependent glutamate synthase beta subunit-like oxidoreductase/2,4-dienoyl-CoA reductase-like NADH-dependent reductase (Old Yellow Enzyme family)
MTRRQGGGIIQAAQSTVPLRSWEFRLRTVEDLKDLSRRLGVNVEAIEDVSILAQPVAFDGLTIPNSLSVHAMEGCDGDAEGRPSKLTLRRYERFGAGGAGLLWAEAIAVVPEARANPRQLWLHKGSRDAFAEMVRRARAKAAEANGKDHHPVMVAQLTHSGRYSKPDGVARPIIGQRDPYRDCLVPQWPPHLKGKSKLPDDYPLVTDEYLDRLQDAYVEAARIAFEIGFDAVDIKACHGYLINELLSCRNRPGKYGGSFENRTRLLVETVERVRTELGDKARVVTRLGIYDAIPYPYGWAVDKDDYTRPDLTEPKKLVGLLRDRGVRLIDITIANPYYNPHVGRPFNEPIVGGYPEPEHPLTGVARLVNVTGQVQKAYPDMAIVGTGYSWLRTLMANVGAANKAKGLVTIVGGGRMAFAYPDFARDIVRKGKMDPEKVCIGCSACTQIMRDGGQTGCVVRDHAVYGPIFRHGRMSDKDNLLRLANNCRKCQEPTCQLACPAGIEIPKFIDLFLDGKEREAYEVIRKANVFPEVCAWLCPVEQQCQGHCLQHFIGDGPLPIADIQRYLSEQANKHGWSKLRIPQKASGKRAAIIGAGPAGLACAARLLEAGHSVTIFDKSTAFGGMVESVIPADRQSRALANELKAIFADVPEDRMTLHLGQELDARDNLDTIMAQGFDAAFIGLGLPRATSVTDTPLDGLWNAMDFLSQAKQPGRLDLTGQSVAVIGGGNTAMDVAVTARQLGAKDVYLIYRRSFKEMPAWGAERQRAIDEGVHFLILTQPLDYHATDGRLTGIKLCPTRLGDPDASGRRRPQAVTSSAYDLDMDFVVEAIGQSAPGDIERILPGVQIANGLIRTDDGTLATSRPGVFAGGDLVRGPSTVVAAVADGMRAARRIDQFLQS